MTNSKKFQRYKGTIQYLLMLTVEHQLGQLNLIILALERNNRGYLTTSPPFLSSKYKRVNQ